MPYSVEERDAGWFFEDEVFKTCAQLNIGYLCGGKQYSNVIDEQYEQGRVGFPRLDIALSKASSMSVMHAQSRAQR